MKTKILMTLVCLFMVNAISQAMEEKHQNKIYLVNDTDSSLQVNEDEKKVELAPHEEETIYPHQVKNVSVNYLEPFYGVRAIPIDVKDIAAKAQANDIRVHIYTRLGLRC